MTTTTTDPAAKIKRNAEIAAKSLHTYVVAAVSCGASVLLALGPSWVTAFIQAHPALSAGAPFVSLVFVLLTQIAPQNITLSADRQKAVDAARAWVLDLAAKAMPGQPMAIPPAVAKAVGLPTVLPAPAAPTTHDLFEDTAPPPMPATAFVGDQGKPMAPIVAPVAPPVAAPAVAAPPAFDLAAQLKTVAPWKSDAEIAAEIAGWSRPPIVIAAP